MNRKVTKNDRKSEAGEQKSETGSQKPEIQDLRTWTSDFRHQTSIIILPHERLIRPTLLNLKKIRCLCKNSTCMNPGQTTRPW